MKKEKILIKAIKIGAATLIGAVAGIFFTLRLGKNKQISLQSDSTVDTIKNAVRNKTDDIQDAMANATEDADAVAKTVHRKTEDVAEDIVHDYHKIKNNIDRKAEDITDEAKKHVNEK